MGELGEEVFGMFFGWCECASCIVACKDLHHLMSSLFSGICGDDLHLQPAIGPCRRATLIGYLYVGQKARRTQEA